VKRGRGFSRTQGFFSGLQLVRTPVTLASTRRKVHFRILYHMKIQCSESLGWICASGRFETVSVPIFGTGAARRTNRSIWPPDATRMLRNSRPQNLPINIIRNVEQSSRQYLNIWLCSIFWCRACGDCDPAILARNPSADLGKIFYIYRFLCEILFCPGLIHGEPHETSHK
jgi:hypothetical protein